MRIRGMVVFPNNVKTGILTGKNCQEMGKYKSKFGEIKMNKKVSRPARADFLPVQIARYVAQYPFPVSRPIRAGIPITPLGNGDAPFPRKTCRPQRPEHPVRQFQ